MIYNPPVFDNTSNTLGTILMEAIEKTGATVEEAVAAGMKELGVSSPTQVMVEVIQEPDQGIMGQGARPAIVRLVYLGSRQSDKPPTSIVTAPPPPPPTRLIITPVNPPVNSPVEFDYDDEEDEDNASEVGSIVVSYDDAEEDAQVGKVVLDELLAKMEIEGDVIIRRAESTRAGESLHWVLNITGKHMNRLIGHRGETLTALQYITRLIVSRRLQRRANLIVDAGGYKAKRSDRLRELANRMADQAIRQGRTVTLEPMPPHERRIIHLTLRKRPDVMTKSIGEGNARKVTISPTK